MNHELFYIENATADVVQETLSLLKQGKAVDVAIGSFVWSDSHAVTPLLMELAKLKK